MLKLYGSTTSPYVRRIRMWLSNVDHEFINLQIFEGKDRELLASHNPTLKIPMLQDGEQMLFDSRVIFRYLTDKMDYPLLSWQQENQLTLIDAANDSLVQLLILKRSEFDTGADKLYFNLQRERVNATLSHLDELVAKGHFNDWHYPSICLFSLVDWIQFREMHDLAGFDQLLAFHADNVSRIEVTATDPRS